MVAYLYEVEMLEIAIVRAMERYEYCHYFAQTQTSIATTVLFPIAQ